LKHYPALDVRSDFPDLLLALVDDFRPTAVEDLDTAVRIFFQTSSDRDAAHRVLAERYLVTAIEVSDEDWARRSQDNLAPVTVGRITIFPNPQSLVPTPQSPVPMSAVSGPCALVIVPSMGFGTGHHATTRLCLAALQTLDLRGLAMLDIGTGSGVLAIAAACLGAARAIGIDDDPDAIQSARENLALNQPVQSVGFEIADLTAAKVPAADVVAANLTGALLVRSASVVLNAVRTGGTLIVSGLLSHERGEVCAAFAPATVVWEREEDGWVGLAMKKS
jgi:ribosomal protein L11 methyltransferase